MSTMSRVEMDRAFVEHMGYEAKDDVEGVLSTLTDDVEHDCVGLPWGVLHGKEGARKNYEFFFPNLKVEGFRDVRRLYGTDFAIFDIECDAVISGEVCGRLEPRGRATFRVLHVLEFKDGKISRENVWADYPGMATTFTPV